MAAGEGLGSAVTGGIGVVAAEEFGVGAEGEPAGQAAGGAGGGHEQAVGRQAGGGQQQGREGVDGTLNEQDGVGRGRRAGQPEAAAVAARA